MTTLTQERRTERQPAQERTAGSRRKKERQAADARKKGKRRETTFLWKGVNARRLERKHVNAEIWPLCHGQKKEFPYQKGATRDEVCNNEEPTGTSTRAFSSTRGKPRPPGRVFRRFSRSSSPSVSCAFLMDGVTALKAERTTRRARS